MRERPPNHDPRAPHPIAVEPGETDLPLLLETLWARRFTGKILFHFRSGYPSVIDELPPSRGRRWLIRRPTS